MTLDNITRFLVNLFSFDEKYPLLFTQFNFWAFFAIVFAGFALTHRRRLLRNSFLFFVSVLFYYKTSGLFVLILIFETVLDYFLGILMDRARRGWVRKAHMVFGVAVNLLVLFYFKYAYFCTDAYNTMVGSDHEVVNWLALWANELGGCNRFDASKILLPVGISFFTFQNISYLVDVYKHKIAHVGNILDFGFYVTFFPQLVAGPIVRADQFVPQLYKKFFLTRRQFGIAVFWILNGLAKKLIMSDYLAVNFVDRVFNNPSLFTSFENLSALFIYSLQVYADFSGYTDIAIGVAMLMGFYLPKNFNSPYKATNPGNFWKRWHISLSNWLKDYLYIPLGGNRNATFGTYFCISVIAVVIVLLTKSAVVAAIVGGVAVILAIASLASRKARLKISTNINMMNTMLLGGLWHGASWNFMIWGGLNGIGILSYKIWKRCNMLVRSTISAAVFVTFLITNYIFGRPVLVIGAVWSGVWFFATLAKTAYSLLWPEKDVPWLDKVWGVVQTFVFISFTRLFFRSGSNLDPAIANETAWETAKSMVNSIGGQWNLAAIPDILANYRGVFVMFAIGMAIHWLPERWKRWYRINFAMLPLWVMIPVVVAVVFVLYQFVTADLQPFIYFQF
ncbi:MAG: MBOAT family O-acyltransferase [Bacteroidales bacterium]|nr:MBOAT family O-acyltransferase [Bacteroidales bacterium]